MNTLLHSISSRHPLCAKALLLALLLPCLGWVADAAPARPKLVMLIAEPEYKTAETLPKFSAAYLEKKFQVVIVNGSTEDGPLVFKGLEELATADVLLVSVRRRIPSIEQMAIIRRYIASGKAVVGIRTASHAFVLRKGEPPAGDEAWPTWDADIFGGNYTNHHGKGPITEISAVQAKHPILRGVALPFTSSATLYKVAPLKSNAEAILMGKIPGEDAQPIAYVAKHVGGGRAFYTSLGDPTDFDIPSFRVLLVNALEWAAGLEVGAKAAVH